MRILLVKTSSMGDVVHNLPAASDIRANYPDAQIDWVVERAFAPIPALHHAVEATLAVDVRAWRRSLNEGSTWREMRAFKRRLQEHTYDLVIDTQGLLKSAVIARYAHGTRCGYDRHSIREPLAARLYNRTFRVSKNLHAVERNRLLVAQALSYRPNGEADYGIRSEPPNFAWLPSQTYAVLLHATSADAKLWPEANWAQLANRLNGIGLDCVLPSGNPTERARAERLAAQIRCAVVAPRMTLRDAASLLGGARVAIGVDTGLTHLAAALGVPSVGIYCASDPALTGLYASNAPNLGTRGQAPAVADVIDALDSMLTA
ncbi:MAG: lipopolysaccharide heptosyltransferase I [Phycisphaerales bacterium]|nr:lipopolysaccharide heptosyltransferase I [Hyphomonadaceae bacterium]